MTRTRVGTIVLLSIVAVSLFGLNSVSGAAGAGAPAPNKNLNPVAAVKSESPNHRSHAAAMLIRRLGLSTYRGSYGGFSYSQAGTHLDIHLTKLDPATEQALLAAVPTGARSSISFVQAGATEQQLDAVQQAITDDIDFLTRSEHLTIASWSPDYVASKNLISVVNPSLEQANYLQNRYGATVEVESAPALPVADASRISDFAPWYGGDFLSNGGEDCTSGVGMHNPAGQQFMVTAAHCFLTGNPVYNAAVSLGFPLKSPSLGNVYARDTRSGGNDAELIPTSASNYIWIGGTATTAALGLDPAYDWVGQGTPVCVDGAFEGVHCTGTTGTEGCLTLTASTGTRYACNEVSVSGSDNQMAGSGDSGGPVFFADTNGNDYVVGIWSAGNGTVACTNWHTQSPDRKCESSGWYADISTIAQLWSLNVNS